MKPFEMTLKEIVDVAQKTDFIFALDTFLDGFNRSCNKEALILEEPMSEILSEKEYVILAAVTEQLTNDYHLITPKWVFKEKYFLKIPQYQFDTIDWEYQKYLRENASDPFRRRNLFYDRNAIMRI